MTLRLPEGLDEQLEIIAARQGTSKHALMVRAAESLVAHDEEQQHLDDAYAFTFERYGKLMERLADA